MLFFSIGPLARPFVRPRGLGSAKQKIETVKYRDKSISVAKNAPKSTESFFKKMGRKISEQFSFLFRKKRNMTVQPHVPAAKAGSAFEEFRSIKNSGLAFDTRKPVELPCPDAPANLAEARTEPVSMQAVEADTVIEPSALAEFTEEPAAMTTANPDAEPAHEEASANEATDANEEEAPPLPSEPAPALPEEASLVEDDASNSSVAVHESGSPLESPETAAPITRSTFLQSMLSGRANLQMPALSPEGYGAASRVHRSQGWLGTGGLQNINGTGLASRTSVQEFAAPKISIPGAWPLRPLEGFYAPPCAIEVAVAAWYAPEQGAEIAAAWRDIAPENGKKLEVFSEYLVRLGNAELGKEIGKEDPRKVILGDVTDFRNTVQGWLTQVSRSPKLLLKTLKMLSDANESCDDRVFLAFNSLQSLGVFDEVKNGNSLKLLDVITAGRQQFREERLQRQAFIEVEARVDKKMASREVWEKVAAAGDLAEKVWKDIRKAVLDGSEELEVHLSMWSDNAKALGLNPPIKGMRFRACSQLTPEIRAEAVRRVKAQENSDFPEWLSNWPTWNAYMQKHHPVEYKEFTLRKDAITDRLERKIAAEVKADIARMQAEGKLPKGMSATRRNELDIRFTNEKWRRLGPESMRLPMQEFAEKLGFAGSVDPRWPTEA